MRRYVWDSEKNAANIRKQGVSFLEAETALDHALSRWELDRSHSVSETRYRTVGWSDRDRLLVVITSEGEGLPRIISARRATKRERDAYERR
jgi:hypothetical protein